MSKKTKQHFNKKDPFHQRESEKYEDPVASREFIINIFEEFGKPMPYAKLIEVLQIQEESKQKALGFRLRAMLRDGQLMQDRRGRYCLFEKINLKRGTIQGHPDGFGFFIPEEGSGDIVLSSKEMRAAMHGDTVLVYQTGVDRRGRPEGKIHEVIEHGHITVVGRYFYEQGVGFVIPNSKHLTHEISIPLDRSNRARNGQIVLVEITNYPTKHTQAIGQVIHILGEHMAPGMEIEMAILTHKIPHIWSTAIEEAVAKIPQHVHPDEINRRTDLRHLPFVTIDGEDAKDFDDAVYCTPKPKGGFKLYVAIADVSHYVPIDSPLDQEALLRGNSVYFPGQVVPMLPEALSNGICSLNPQVDRLCMIIDMTITEHGKISRPQLYRGVIHSHARLTYTQVNQWIQNKQADALHQSLWPMIESLNALYQVLAQTRKERGAMDFDSVETRIIFDENRKIKQIIPTIRNDAHRIIEECMLAANVATAGFLQKTGIPTLYRVHASPEPEKIVALRQFLGELGLILDGGPQPKPKDFQKTLLSLEKRPEKHLVETVLLRSLKQAHYTEVNEGHFGLAYQAYTHFTSPIRRYPDLLIHRAIGHILDHQPLETFAYSQEKMGHLGKHCSITERRADDATREVVAWLKCEYMRDKLGQTFRGRISAVTGFGLFVELDDIYVEGLVHITALKNDYYAFDAVKHRLVGERTGKIYRLGDYMHVQVVRVDLDERKIDFEPVLSESNA